MKVDIWSDVRCPYCYIGKRKFETALQQFEHKAEIEVEWHSFELDPSARTMPDVNIYDYIADRYGRSKEWAVDSHQQITETAAAAGLIFNFDEVVVANSFDAHRLIQLAKTRSLGDAAEEHLFKAHFTDGKNIADHDALISVAEEAGLDKEAAATMLKGTNFTDEVKYDEQIAQTLNIRGVPFFLFNEKLSVSGAQAPETFLGALRQAWKADAEDF